MTENNNGLWVTATEIGNVGVSWSDVGITRVEIGTTRRSSGLVPAWVKDVTAKIRAHFAGHAQDFGDVPLDWSGVTAFQRQVYEAARKIPCGRRATYGDVAREIGAPGAARAVGQALGKNRFGIIVPCHRIVAVGAKMGGFSSPHGVALKEKMLAIEEGEPC